MSETGHEHDAGWRVLVTGAAGFLGSALVPRLLGAGYRVRALDLSPRVGELDGDVQILCGDVRDRAIAESAVQDVRFVIHCAAAQPVSRSRRRVLYDVNVRGTARMLEAAERAGVDRFVHVSSSAPYGIAQSWPIRETTAMNPVCDYGRSKVHAERVCARHRARGLDVVVLRPRVLLGAGRLGVYQMLFDWIADDKPLYLIGAGRQPFQALSVHDMVEACVLALEGDCENEDINLGARDFATFRDDIQGLMRHAGNRRRVVSLPALPAKAMLSALDVLDLSPLTAWHYLTVDRAFVFDCSKARDVLGWVPRIGNLQMLVESYDWYVQHRAQVDPDLGTTHRKALSQRALRWVKAIS